MEKIYEYIVVKHNTDFYKSSNSLDPIKVTGKGLFGDEDWSYTAKSVGTKKHPHFEFDTVKGSLKDEKTFEDNYGNPLCGVQISRRTLCVDKTDKKISIKLFSYERSRKPGKPYFVKSTVLYFLTYNYITNSLYHGSLKNYHLKRKCVKNLRRATLWEDPIESFKEKINGFLNQSFIGGNAFIDKFDVNTPIQKFVESIPGIKEFDVNPKYSLYKHLLVTSGVKLSNNWKTFIHDYPQPKKTDYKKVGFKYVDAFMSIRGMKGDKLKRVLHTVNSFNTTAYVWVLNLFGEKFISSLPDNDLKIILECNITAHEYVKPELYNFTKSELKNIFTIFKDEVCNGTIDFVTLMDHFRFNLRLLKLQPVKWKSKTLNQFVNEHDEWSTLVSSYTNGVINRRYGRYFNDKIEETISLHGVDYFPILLKTTQDYNNESNVQTNCVRTYINRPDCFIISLRKGGSESYERLTIEFAISVVKDELKIMRVQTKAKRNSQPDISWSDVLNILDNKVKRLNELKFFTLPEKDTEYKLGMKEHSEAIIYNTGNYSTIIWDDSVEKMKLHDSRFHFQNDFDDLPV